MWEFSQSVWLLRASSPDAMRISSRVDSDSDNDQRLGGCVTNRRSIGVFFDIHDILSPLVCFFWEYSLGSWRDCYIHKLSIARLSKFKHRTNWQQKMNRYVTQRGRQWDVTSGMDRISNHNLLFRHISQFRRWFLAPDDFVQFELSGKLDSLCLWTWLVPLPDSFYGL